MKIRKVIIDGYNLLMQSRFGRYLAKGGQLQSARMALVRFLSFRMDLSERESIVIVFDAKGIDTKHPRSLRYADIKVEFAAGYDEADDRIEELIQQHGSSTELTVVSSDRRLQRAVKKKNGNWKEPLDWLDIYSNRAAKAPIDVTNERLVNSEKLDEGAPADSEDEKINFQLWADFYDLDENDLDSLVTDVMLEHENTEKHRQAQVNTEYENPFPPGYAEDLLEED